MKRIVFLIFCVVFSACKREPDFLAESLQFAGDNRAALEKTLLHYSINPADSLKYRAAVFLISNMAVHYSYSGSGLEEYYDAVDSVSANFANNSELASGALRALKPLKDLKPLSDLQIVSADYLIKNIDRAFDDWQNGVWAQHLDFEMFCEYLLPYKVCETQTLDDWREYLSTPEFGDFQYLPYTMAYKEDVRAAKIVNRALESMLSKTSVKSSLPSVRRIRTLIKSVQTKDCEDFSVVGAATMRAKGIPVAIDFTPRWSNSSKGHVWCALLDNFGRNTPFDGMSKDIDVVLRTPMSKAYRYTWAINPELLALANYGEPVPDNFKNVCIKDVTDLYVWTSDISIPIEKCKNQYAYLCTFNNREWEPVAIGKIKGKKAVFEKVGRDVVYLPVIMDEDGMQPIGEAFILDSRGEVQSFRGVAGQARNDGKMRLYRKHPYPVLFTFRAMKIIGSRIEAANKADFSDAVTVHTIETFGTESGEVLPDATHKYRYWRLFSAPDGDCSISEMYFFQNGENITKKGKIIGTAGKTEEQQPSRVFDNEPVTFFSAPTPSGGWVGLDFGESTVVDRILYIPHNDANGIAWGDEYELKYWGDNRWISLGKKIADNIFVEFENCPTSALFWLHDCTRGVEDRIFTYEDGKQVFW
jgi:hypothetical protein